MKPIILKCPICDYAIKNPQDLVLHRIVEHKGQIYQATIRGSCAINQKGLIQTQCLQPNRK